jgi:hypothetical protein
MRTIITSGLFALCASIGSAATLYTTNFETNPSANFTVAITSADTEADFAYNYATWTPTAPTAGIASITLAPNSAAGGTKALKVRSNFDATGTNEAVTAFINASAGLTSWSLTFDAYQLWNGPADVSGTGTTTGFTFGNATPNSVPFNGTGASLNGWFIMMTGEGGQGASGDARYYSGTGGAPTINLATPNWKINGGTTLPTDMPNAAGTAPATWDTVFASPNYPQPGTPGRQWVTWEIIQRQNGVVTISVTPVGGVKTQVASWTQSSSGTLGVGFWDLNNGSVADPPADNFVLIDNLTLATAPAISTAAQDWQLFN